MSTYNDETWIDKMLAGTVIILTASIALMPVPKVNLESVALAAFAVIASIAVLFVLRSGWLVNVLWTKCRLHWVVVASALLGAVFGKLGWLASAVEWTMLAAIAWLTLLLTLVVGRAVAWIVLWPVLWLARQIGFGRAPARGGSYASPSPRRSPVSAQRRYTAPAGTGYSGAGYAAAGAGAATGYAAGQVWGDMHDPSDPVNQLAAQQAQQLAQMQEPSRMFPEVNPTTGATMSSDSGVDDFGHVYCDPTPIFETQHYDYTPSYDCGNSCGGGGGGGFDF